MSSTLIARKDFEDAVRSRMIWAVMGVFVFLMVVISAGAASNGLAEAEPTEIIPLVANIGGQLMIPVLALLVGYMAIVGERQSGSLRVLFGLSHSRWNVFLGKLASRLGVIVVATAVACLVALGMVVAMFDSFPARTLLAFSLLTVLLGMVFTAIAVAVSAMSASRMQAMAGAIGSYVLFTLGWHPLVAGVHYLVEGSLPGYEAAGWYFFLLRLNPLEAYTQVSSELADQFIWGIFGWQGVVEDIPAETLQEPNALMLSNRLGGDLPLYLQEWTAVPILLLWIAIPLAIGYWRFEGADLN
ncbi:ABC transporter permease subunit [Halosolutus amylolyticus]|uniref:ABC transporter permease subunit n=1 Tax=Halosolutus amylolyticus TaxID=2932267 RepID=A0ABD5PKT8_9EURY|nr:ABC transporter permease subunit [Halosolutus amylolyticus]